MTSYELLRMGIPEKLYLYEEEEREVLSGNETTIDPQKLHLDFTGEVEIINNTAGKYEAVCNLFGMIPLKNMEISVVSNREAIPGGIPVGIYVQTRGVFVIGTGDIESAAGTIESPAKNILKTGDYITSVQGVAVERKQELIQELSHFQGDKIKLGIRRQGEEIEIAVKPVIAEDGAKIGVWVRDDTQGVGTLTYVTSDRKFGALGHGISDTDSALLMEVSEGKLYDCTIFDIKKGQKGTPGKLSGKITYSPKNLYGEVAVNLSGGIYGTANNHLMNSLEREPIPIALKQNVKEGHAVILSSVSGELKEYAIKIEKVYKSNQDVNRGMVVRVVDEELLELTGGIVQGMGVIDNRDNTKSPKTKDFQQLP